MQLAILKDQCSSLKEIQSGNNRNLEENDDLVREVQRLRQIKNNLQNDLISKKTKTIQQKIQESLSSEAKLSKSSAETREEILDEITQDAKRRKISNLYNAYRLLSRNITYVDEKHVGFRFETFHSGKYQNRFYIICEYSGDNDMLSIWKHTLPSFVPLNQLAQDHLNRDLDQFLDIIEEQLQVYVNRREEIQKIKENYEKKSVKVFANTAFNYVHINVPYKTKIFDIYLIYDNLMVNMPTRVNVFSQDKDAEPTDLKMRAKEREQLFLKNPIQLAFSRSFPSL